MENRPQPRVLIFDRSLDSVQVLQTLLHRRGVTAAGTSRVQRARQLAHDTTPELIVLSDDFFGDDFSDDQGLPSPGFPAEPTSLVILGKLRSRLPNSGPTTELAKPYHYSALVRKIEELLCSERAA